MTTVGRSLRRAFVFGNAAIDEVYQVQALPAPGESIHGTAMSLGLGGKGANQAIALSRTGIPTTLFVALGQDWQGQKIREVLLREPLEAIFSERADLPTDRSIIFGEWNGDNVIVTTNECARSISFAECMAVLSRSNAGDAVLIQGNLRADVTSELSKEARRRNAFLVLNPSPFNDVFRDLVPLADAVFVNETEARALTGKSGQEAASSLLSAGAEQVILTLGKRGAILASKEETVHVPAVHVNVVDVTGAGDCFEGVAVGSALARGNRIDEASLVHASEAAAQTIAKHGATKAFPTSQEVINLINGRRAR